MQALESVGKVKETLPGLAKVNSFGSVGFSGFLTVVSRVRSWLQSAMKEELRPLFERCLRRRGKVVGQDNTFVGIREVCFTLETLDLAPHNFEEQGRLGKLLDDANEWGFEPMTMDFEAFVRFIRIVREWKASRKYTLDLAAAVKKFRFSEPEINEFRVAFDITDAKGNGEVDILGVRRIFKMLRWNISSDTLRAMFSKAKAEGGSTASFFEVLQILSAYATRSWDASGWLGGPRESLSTLIVKLVHTRRLRSSGQARKPGRDHRRAGSELLEFSRVQPVLCCVCAFYARLSLQLMSCELVRAAVKGGHR